MAAPQLPRVAARPHRLPCSIAALSLCLSLPPGGYDGKTFMQHMYGLDSVTGKWNVVPAQGTAPPPMCGAATVLAGNDLFVFGQEQGEDSAARKSMAGCELQS